MFKIDQHYKWSIVDLIKFFNFNCLIFCFKRESLDNACLLYHIVHYQQIIFSYVSSSSSLLFFFTLIIIIIHKSSFLNPENQSGPMKKSCISAKQDIRRFVMSLERWRMKIQEASEDFTKEGIMFSSSRISYVQANT